MLTLRNLKFWFKLIIRAWKIILDEQKTDKQPAMFVIEVLDEKGIERWLTEQINLALARGLTKSYNVEEVGEDAPKPTINTTNKGGMLN